MDEQLKAEMELYFTPARRAALVEAVRDSYQAVLAIYSPEDGWDPQMFGFSIYKYVTHRLVKLTKEPTLGIELRSPGPAVRFGVGPFTLAAYCCGQSGSQDINESFPNNENGAPALVDLNQFTLNLEFTPLMPRALVLAHMGNALMGAEAVYLAVPMAKQDGKIGEWSLTEPLWRLDMDDMSGDPGPSLPPAAPTPDAPLTLKKPVEKTGDVMGT